MPGLTGASARRASNAATLPLSPSPLTRSASAMSQYRGLGGDLATPKKKSDASESRNVRVVIRIRPSDPDDTSVPPRFRGTAVQPLSVADIQVDADPAILTGHAAGSAGNGKRQHVFSYDHVLGEASNQVDVYDATAQEVVDDFLNGHNVTFLAYGQTSSGKSYTMGTTGEDIDYSGSSFTPRTGLIPRTVEAILQRAEEARSIAGAGASWECRLSFLELYNEEIIDLLSGAGVQVTVREERDGRIVWAGVREVKVRTLAEVMGHLQEGSTRRKTGETGMNATSSRSHAIFSLTLVQRYRATSSSSLAASPNRHSLSLDHGSNAIKRAPSLIGLPAGSRASTPLSSRGPPPSAFSLQPPPRSGLPRPNSMTFGKENRSGEVIVTTSKFNMVDLAGSERLKRTAAQGERMKEGISINSGLSALGNVISTLCDPVKSKGHVPYRDSKLTRMLQDSIGGNALTTMIACVSPTEYNVVETINTLKYAQRARAIQNTAKVNAVEAGWEDLEHLQGVILKLRKQVTDLETARQNDNSRMELQRMMTRLSGLQREHTELHDRYLHKCSENMRLHGELKVAKPTDGENMANFSEIVEPVILEYEKVVSGLNKQLEELQVQVDEMSLVIASQTAELDSDRHAARARDLEMSDLQSRVSKLSERNQSGESYIQDLEAKLRALGKDADSHNETMGDLRKEISELRAGHMKAVQHATDVEARLEAADVQSGKLGAQVEKLERDVERREKAYSDLENHMASLDFTEDRRKLVEKIEERDRTIQALNSLQTSKDGAPGAVTPTGEHFSPTNVDSLEALPTTAPSSRPPSGLDVLHSPETGLQAGWNGDMSPEVRTRIDQLTQRCASAEEKASMLERQLGQVMQASSSHQMFTPPRPVGTRERDEESDATGTVLDTPPSSSVASFSGFSPQSRRRSMPLTSGTTTLIPPKPNDGLGFRGGRGSKGSRLSPRDSPRLSLSQELSSAYSSAGSPNRTTGSSSDGLRKLLLPRAGSLDIAATPRSAASLEMELRYVHKILEEREAELRARKAYILQLESENPLNHKQQSHTAPSLIIGDSAHTMTAATQIPLPPSPTDDHHIDSSPLYTGRGEHQRQDTITRKSSWDIQQSSERSATITEKDASLREMVTQRFAQIADPQEANGISQEGLDGPAPGTPHLSRLRDRQSLNPLLIPESPAASAYSDVEIDRLRRDHAEELEQLATEHAELTRQLHAAHAVEIGTLRDAEEAANIAQLQGLEKCAALRADFDTDRERLTAVVESAAAEHLRELERLDKDHQKEVAKLHRTHVQAMAAVQQDMDAVTEDLLAQMNASDEDRRKLKLKLDQTVFEMSRLRDQAQLEKNQVARQLAEMQKNNNALVEDKAALEARMVSLAKDLAEGNHRLSRKSSVIPPQGPPPTGPLPPLPLSPAMPSPALPLSPPHTIRSWSSGTLMSKVDPTRRDSDAPYGPSLGNSTVSSQDGHATGDDLSNARLRQVEVQLLEEQARATGLGRDLADAKRANVKLKTHLEDVREELKRQSEMCRGHSDELAERRQAMESLAEETTNSRDSLLAANAQVVTLKAQLDKAVDDKVNKKLASRLKCF